MPDDDTLPADDLLTVSTAVLAAVRDETGELELLEASDFPDLAGDLDWRDVAYHLAATALDLERRAEIRVAELSDEAERAVRRDERERVAKVLEENEGTLTSFVPDGNVPLSLVVLLLRLDHG